MDSRSETQPDTLPLIRTLPVATCDEIFDSFARRAPVRLRDFDKRVKITIGLFIVCNMPPYNMPPYTTKGPYMVLLDNCKYEFPVSGTTTPVPAIHPKPPEWLLSRGPLTLKSQAQALFNHKMRLCRLRNSGRTIQCSWHRSLEPTYYDADGVSLDPIQPIVPTKLPLSTRKIRINLVASIQPDISAGEAESMQMGQYGLLLLHNGLAHRDDECKPGELQIRDDIAWVAGLALLSVRDQDLRVRQAYMQRPEMADSLKAPQIWEAAMEIHATRDTNAVQGGLAAVSPDPNISAASHSRKRSRPTAGSREAGLEAKRPKFGQDDEDVFWMQKIPLQYRLLHRTRSFWCRMLSVSNSVEFDKLVVEYPELQLSSLVGQEVVGMKQQLPHLLVKRNLIAK